MRTSDTEPKTKVFGVGLHKTGTTSLRSAMPMLGYKTVQPWRWTGRYHHTLSEDVLLQTAFRLANTHDACIHSPFMTFHEELFAAYPDAKFVLTTRDEQKWLESLLKYFEGANWPEFRFVYGIDANTNAAEHLKDIFRQHNQDVRDFFADKPDSLLEMDISQGDGWQKLCDFLGCDIPEQSFPKSNENGSLYARFVMRAVPFIATARRAISGQISTPRTAAPRSESEQHLT